MQTVLGQVMLFFGRFFNVKMLKNEPCVNWLIVVVRAMVPASYKPRLFRVVVIDYFFKKMALSEIGGRV